MAEDDRPDVTRDPDGGLYLEWETGDRGLTICVAPSREGSYVYMREGEVYAARPLTLSALREGVDFMR